MEVITPELLRECQSLLNDHTFLLKRILKADDWKVIERVNHGYADIQEERYYISICLLLSDHYGQ